MEWWRRSVIYQIYPRSFQDSDGNGVGDLEGVRRRLDYLKGLGVGAIWISPIYPSPMADFGYDVSNYCGVDPLFGTLASFDALLKEAHARGLKVILDFVPNHTSDQHPWFLESRKSKDNPKRDWYLWRDGHEGAPPNNWIANFGGSAWEFDPATGQYYLHSFLKEQPDLNWRHPEVRQAMMDSVRFWLDRGVDGFRVDVIWLLIKDEEFRDNPPNPAWTPDKPEIERLLQVYSADRPEIHDVIEDLRATIDAFQDRVLIGEIYLPIERLVAYYGRDLKGAHLPFNFHLISTAWRPDAIAKLIAEYEASLPQGAWPNWVLGNHDQKRIATRIGPQQARVAAMLLLTLRGTPTLYYGDEIGMENGDIPSERAQDPWEKREPGLGLGRDPQRTPMCWDASPNAGFTQGTPWLPLNADYKTRNVAAQLAERRTLLQLYKRLISLRTTEAPLASGTFKIVSVKEALLVYDRIAKGRTVRVGLNFSNGPIPVPFPTAATVLASTELDRAGQTYAGALELRPNEGVVLQLS